MKKRFDQPHQAPGDWHKIPLIDRGIVGRVFHAKQKAGWCSIAILGLACLLLTVSVHGHSVIVWAESENNRVTVQGYLSNGSRLQQGDVFVTDGNGKQLVQGALDENGRFKFNVPTALPMIVIKITLDNSHHGEVRLNLESRK